jgi:ribosomal protein L37AE/L43A
MENYCLKWNEFEANIRDSFRKLREDRHQPSSGGLRSPKGIWFCPMCRSTSTKRKLEFEDESKKATKKPKTLKVKCDDCGNLFAKTIYL